MWDWIMSWFASQKKRGRSSQWPKVRDAHLKREPECQVCGQKDNLNVHHKLPYHLYPEAELLDSNLITLCEGPGINCHITFGHLGAWASWNAKVEEDVKTWRDKIAKRPKDDKRA